MMATTGSDAADVCRSKRTSRREKKDDEEMSNQHKNKVHNASLFDYINLANDDVFEDPSKNDTDMVTPVHGSRMDSLFGDDSTSGNRDTCQPPSAKEKVC